MTRQSRNDFTQPQPERSHQPSKRWLHAILCLLLAGSVASVPGSVAAKKSNKHATPTPKAVSVSARTIDKFHPSQIISNQFGKLRFLGGLQLTSPWTGFGGWSDLTIERDGRRLLAISDDGNWMKASIKYDGLKPVGLTNAQHGQLQALSGRVLSGKRERDAEGIALVKGTLDHGKLLISFERIHRIGKFKTRKKGIIGPSRYLKLPRKARSLKRNKGLESIAIIRAGRFKGATIAIAERNRGKKSPAHRPGWILTSGKSYPFHIKDNGDMDVTSLAGLPNGDILILERRFRWSEGVKMRIRRIAGKDLRPGTVVDGEILLEAGLGYQVDNMEGLTTHQGPNGETILTLISDDNFNKLLQRTILLQFQLDAPKLRARNK